MLIAPAGYRFQLSGNITTERNYDYLNVYDGSSNSDRPLLNKVSSAANGETTAIGPVTSTGNSMMLYFYSDTYRLYAGLDLTVTIEAIPWSGSGSSADPYIIKYPSQLDLLAHRVNGTHGQTRQSDGYSGTYFKLGADITYDPNISNNYETIGAYYSSSYITFGGKFDGQGYTVSGIRINKVSNSDADGDQGLFGRIMNSAEVKNVILADAIITGYSHVGGIVGGNDGGTITDCHVLSNVTIRNVNYDAVCHGGIAGYNHDGGTIIGCTSAATLADENNYSYYVGGIAGHNTGSISQCLYLGTTLGGKYLIGAIVGYNYRGTVETSYFTDAQIQGKDRYGTLANAESAVGYNQRGTVATTVGPALRDDADNTGFLALLAARNTALTAVSRTPALSTDVTLSYIRTFTADVASTICLPFAMTSITGGTAYEFIAMNKSGDDWIATMEAVTSTVAGKPYLFKASADGAVSFSGTVANGFDGTAGTSSATYNGDGSWTFRGTYTKLTYGTNLDGAVYGFAGQSYSTNNINPGDFVKAQTDAYIPPFRCYLTYNAPSSARSLTRGADIELPRRIIVHLVDKNGSKTAIGTMDTKTGEVVFGDTWYTLDGRRIEGQPSTKGVYINNGKKVIVK